jgi:hypothetical protein
MKLSELKIDSQAIQTGRWIDAPGLPGCRFKVRGIGNSDYRRLHQKLIGNVPRTKKVGGTIEPDEIDRITATLLVETVLLDWSGFENDDGLPLVYSKDASAKILTDPDFSVVRDSVFAAAQSVGEEMSESVEDDTKN